MSPLEDPAPYVTEVREHMADAHLQLRAALNRLEELDRATRSQAALRHALMYLGEAEDELGR